MSRRPAERRRMCSMGVIKYSSCDISTVQARLKQSTDNTETKPSGAMSICGMGS